MAKHDCLGAWSARGTECAVEICDRLSLIIVGDIARDVVDRVTKVELQLCADDGDEPQVEPCIDGKDGELQIISIPMSKQASGQ